MCDRCGYVIGLVCDRCGYMIGVDVIGVGM